MRKELTLWTKWQRLQGLQCCKLPLIPPDIQRDRLSKGGDAHASLLSAKLNSIYFVDAKWIIK